MANLQGTEILSIRAAGPIQELEKSPVCMRMEGSVAAIDIRGPILHHGSDCCSYDAIKDTVKSALASSATAVLLSIDSPGGMVSGCMDTAQEIRKLADAAGKPLYAYVDGTTCSAAYLGLACVADRIFAPATGEVGSLGVITQRVDVSALKGAMGVGVYTITSGKKKTYNNEDVEVTSEELADTQAKIDYLAEVMLGFAATSRGKSVEDFLSRDGGVQARSVGLVDEIATYDEVLAAISAGSVGGAVASSESVGMEKEEAIKALRAAAEDGDEKAKAMLAVYDGEEDKAEEEEEEAPPSEKKEEEEGKKALAAVQALRAEMAEEKRESAVSAMLSTRQDLPEKMVKLLATQSVSQVKSFLEALPVVAKATPVADAVAAAKSPASVTQGGEVRAMSDRVRAVLGADSLKFAMSKQENSYRFGVSEGGK